ncbi:MAG: 4-hydroxythreonine-4-phosphate dehydrogenase PdxA [Candidatus Aminicenantales bacterium]
MRPKKGGRYNINGPFHPDVIFHLILDQFQQIVIALYHDQGAYPL